MGDENNHSIHIKLHHWESLPGFLPEIWAPETTILGGGVQWFSCSFQWFSLVLFVYVALAKYGRFGFLLVYFVCVISFFEQ